jgi:hypothetical protein
MLVNPDVYYFGIEHLGKCLQVLIVEFRAVVDAKVFCHAFVFSEVPKRMPSIQAIIVGPSALHDISVIIL